MTISLLEQDYIANQDPTFRARISQAMIDEAHNRYHNITPSTDQIEQVRRLAMAVRIIQNLEAILTPYARYAVTKTAIESAASVADITDANIDSAVADTFDEFAMMYETVDLNVPILNYLKPSAALLENTSRVSASVDLTTVLTSGKLSLVAAYLPAGTVVTSISFVSGVTGLTRGTSDSHLWFALYESNGTTLLRQSTDDTAGAWAATSLLTKTLTTPYAVAIGGLHYLGIMINSGTGGSPVMPTLRGFNTSDSVAGLAPIIVGQTSNTALVGTAPNPAGALTVVSGFPYAYVS